MIPSRNKLLATTFPASILPHSRQLLTDLHSIQHELNKISANEYLNRAVKANRGILVPMFTFTVVCNY